MAKNYVDFTEEQKQAFRAGLTHGYLSAVSDKLTRGKKIGKGLARTVSEAEEKARDRAKEIADQMDASIEEGMVIVGVRE